MFVLFVCQSFVSLLIVIVNTTFFLRTTSPPWEFTTTTNIILQKQRMGVVVWDIGFGQDYQWHESDSLLQWMIVSLIVFSRRLSINRIFHVNFNARNFRLTNIICWNRQNDKFWHFFNTWYHCVITQLLMYQVWIRSVPLWRLRVCLQQGLQLEAT